MLWCTDQVEPSAACDISLLTCTGWQDRVISFWEVTKGQLEDACAEGRQKDREADHQVEVHQVELKVCAWPDELPARLVLSAVSIARP